MRGKGNLKLYLEVTQDEYQLPIVVASSVPELARKTGSTIQKIWVYLNNVKRGVIKKPRFIEVVLDDENVFREIIKTEKCCGTCVWHKHEFVKDEWICANGKSKHCFDGTNYYECCKEYEER